MRRTYWVMYRQTVPLQAGGVVERTTQHFGTDSEQSAYQSVATLKEEYIAKGKGLGYKCVMHEAWVELEVRGRIDQ